MSTRSTTYTFIAALVVPNFPALRRWAEYKKLPFKTDADLARRYHHLTAADAARIARDAGARRLVITHFSQRYPDVRVLLDEALAVFDDVVAAEDLLRVPVPERRRVTSSESPISGVPH